MLKKSAVVFIIECFPAKNKAQREMFENMTQCFCNFVRCNADQSKNIVLLHLQSATKKNRTLSLFTPFLSFWGPRRHTG